MLAIELPRQSGEYAGVRPPCPSCGRLMHLTRTTPHSDVTPALCVFKCGECGVWLTEAADEHRSI
jgi:hypothetical protein